jgi:integrase
MSQLTARRIDTLKPNPTRDTLVADGDGLYLKVATSGTKSFVYRYTYVRQRRAMTLGTYPELGLAEAREKRLEAARTLADGKDPILVRRSAQDVKLQAVTVRQAIEMFHERWLCVHYKRPDPAADFLRVNLNPVIGDILVCDVEPQHVTAAINKIVARGSKVTANRTLPLARKLFDFCKAQHLRGADQANPVTITPKDAGGREKAKSTNLQWEHIADFIKLMDSDDIDLTIQTRLGLLLVLATAKRPIEVVTMEWSEVDLDRGTWWNPKHKTKEEHDDHLVFLNAYAVGILRKLWIITGHTPYVFLSTRASSEAPRPMARHTLSQAVLDLYNEGRIKLKFTPHDFRRTFSSRMADLEIQPHVVEKILDHLMVGSMAVYNRATYYGPRKAAMDLWGAKLAEISCGRLVTGDLHLGHASQHRSDAAPQGVAAHCGHLNCDDLPDDRVRGVPQADQAGQAGRGPAQKPA